MHRQNEPNMNNERCTTAVSNQMFPCRQDELGLMGFQCGTFAALFTGFLVGTQIPMSRARTGTINILVAWPSKMTQAYT